MSKPSTLLVATILFSALTGCGSLPQGAAKLPTKPHAVAVTPATTLGTVSVSLKGLAKYTVLATQADVAFVRLTLSVATVPFGPQSAPQTKLLSRREFQGTPEFQFTNVRPGTATLAVEALDANQSSLGYSKAERQVVAGQVTPMPVTIDLRSQVGTVNAVITILTDDTQDCGCTVALPPVPRCEAIAVCPQPAQSPDNIGYMPLPMETPTGINHTPMPVVTPNGIDYTPAPTVTPNGIDYTPAPKATPNGMMDLSGT